MESESGRKRPEDQLQGFAVQDETVQHRAAQSGLTKSAARGASPASERVVIQYGDRTVKGIAETSGTQSVEQLLRNPRGQLTSLRLYLHDSGQAEDCDLESAKAIFLVRTFDGDDSHNPLHFHNNTPVMPGLWVRVEFQDDEVMEGIVLNTRDYVLDSGFLLIPTDPGSNNRLVYVFKSGLKNFQVLGMRNPPKGQTKF